MNKGIFSLVVWIVLIAILVGCHIEMCKPESKNTVHDTLLIQDKDARGYTSIVFTEGKDTFGLDYLTPHELDSFKLDHNFK